MANAKKCDRCGKFYDEYNTCRNNKKPNGIQVISLDTNHKYFEYALIDLCPECMDQFQEWLKPVGNTKSEEE